MYVENHEGYSIVKLPKAVNLNTAFEFKKVLISLYEQGCNTINVDCSHLEMIDSTGIGSLVLFRNYFA